MIPPRLRGVMIDKHPSLASFAHTLPKDITSAAHEWKGVLFHPMICAGGSVRSSSLDTLLYALLTCFHRKSIDQHFHTRTSDLDSDLNNSYTLSYRPTVPARGSCKLDHIRMRISFSVP